MDWSVRHKLLLLGALKRCGPEDWNGVAGMLSTHPWFESPVLEENCRMAYSEIIENFSEIKLDSSFILDHRYNILISTLHKEYTEVIKSEIEATKEKINSLTNQNNFTKPPVADQDLSENNIQPVDEVLTISEQESQTPLPFPTEEIHVPLTDGSICTNIELGHSAKLDSVLPVNCSLEKKDFQQYKSPLSHQKETLKNISLSPSGLAKVTDSKENVEIINDLPQKALSIQHKRTVAQPLRLSPLKKRLVNHSHRGLSANLFDSRELPKNSDSISLLENNILDPSPKKVLPVNPPLALESKNDLRNNSLSEETSFLDSSIIQNETLDPLEQITSSQADILPCSPTLNVSEKINFEKEEKYLSKSEIFKKGLAPNKVENSTNCEELENKSGSDHNNIPNDISCPLPHPDEKSLSSSVSPTSLKRPFSNLIHQTTVAIDFKPTITPSGEGSKLDHEEINNCTGVEDSHDVNSQKKLRLTKTPGLELVVQDETLNKSPIEGELLEDLEALEISPGEADKIISPEISNSDHIHVSLRACSVEHELDAFDSTGLLPKILNEVNLDSESARLSSISHSLVDPLEGSKSEVTDKLDSNVSIILNIDESHVSIDSLRENTLHDTSVDSCLSSLNTAGATLAGEDNSLISNLPADTSVVSNSFDTNIISSPLTIKDDSSMVVGAEANIEDIKTQVLKDEIFPSDRSNHSPSLEPQEIYIKTDSEASPDSSSSYKDDCSVKSHEVPKVSSQPSMYSKTPENSKKRTQSTQILTIDVLSASELSHIPTEATTHDRTRLDSPGYKKWKKLAFIVFKEIANHRLAPIFQRPIKESVAPGYFSIVKCPMDLYTIQNRIKQGIITTTDEFSRDLLLMCGNALMFNRADSEIYGMAKEMLESVEMHLKTLHAADLYHSTTPAAPTPQPESAPPFS